MNPVRNSPPQGPSGAPSAGAISNGVKHFLHIADHSAEELSELLTSAVALKKEWKKGGNKPILEGKVLGMLFEKPSLRTRVSFDMAMRHLGGDALYLSPAEVGLGKREATSDVARVLSRYVQGIMLRTFAHQNVLDIAKYASIPVINGLSDYNHPCQALADALTILEHKGTLKGLKLAFIGDGNNVTTSLAHLSAKLGMDFAVASPKGYELPADVVKGSGVALAGNPAEAVKNADVVYTDTWTSMGDEAEADRRKKEFGAYQVNSELLKKAQKDAIVMHCLPAHRGEEITDAVMDGPQSVVFDQAENRMHAQKAILAKLLAQ
ncbi:MAG: Ornithine carbamoyltransferase, catabolic [Candidatus Kaiserbacteria bacterium GW2011_GWA2_58_9]|uniref:Ornithine carbamoyltransferase n=1 Tax=Candidatus Kaiserbacteria bacterium GW2011_GWA2_58_9 TaxID=1618672 RepID=A0A0G1YV29_9BACT|nr:MAG: Ornithine carbamoyltransferase, catabolic [Candidatus Kaiserbacteria bacterium GW2011_GWA2_58_9]